MREARLMGSTRVPSNTQTPRASSSPKSRNIFSGIHAHAGLVDHATEQDCRTYFRRKLRLLHHAHLVIELSRNNFHLPGVCFEVRLLARNLEVPGLRERALSFFTICSTQVIVSSDASLHSACTPRRSIRSLVSSRS